MLLPSSIKFNPVGLSNDEFVKELKKQKRQERAKVRREKRKEEKQNNSIISKEHRRKMLKEGVPEETYDRWLGANKKAKFKECFPGFKNGSDPQILGVLKQPIPRAIQDKTAPPKPAVCWMPELKKGPIEEFLTSPDQVVYEQDYRTFEGGLSDADHIELLDFASTNLKRFSDAMGGYSNKSEKYKDFIDNRFSQVHLDTRCFDELVTGFRAGEGVATPEITHYYEGKTIKKGLRCMHDKNVVTLLEANLQGIGPVFYPQATTPISLKSARMIATKSFGDSYTSFNKASKEIAQRVTQQKLEEKENQTLQKRCERIVETDLMGYRCIVIDIDKPMKSKDLFKGLKETNILPYVAVINVSSSFEGDKHKWHLLIKTDNIINPEALWFSQQCWEKIPEKFLNEQELKWRSMATGSNSKTRKGSYFDEFGVERFYNDSCERLERLFGLWRVLACNLKHYFENNLEFTAREKASNAAADHAHLKNSMQILRLPGFISPKTNTIGSVFYVNKKALKISTFEEVELKQKNGEKNGWILATRLTQQLESQLPGEVLNNNPYKAFGEGILNRFTPVSKRNLENKKSVEAKREEIEREEIEREEIEREEIEKVDTTEEDKTIVLEKATPVKSPSSVPEGLRSGVTNPRWEVFDLDSLFKCFPFLHNHLESCSFDISGQRHEFCFWMSVVTSQVLSKDQINDDTAWAKYTEKVLNPLFDSLNSKDLQKSKTTFGIDAVKRGLSVCTTRRFKYPNPNFGGNYTQQKRVEVQSKVKTIIDEVLPPEIAPLATRCLGVICERIKTEGKWFVHSSALHEVAQTHYAKVVHLFESWGIFEVSPEYTPPEGENPGKCRIWKLKPFHQWQSIEMCRTLTTLMLLKFNWKLSQAAPSFKLSQLQSWAKLLRRQISLSSGYLNEILELFHLQNSSKYSPLSLKLQDYLSKIHDWLNLNRIKPSLPMFSGNFQNDEPVVLSAPPPAFTKGGFSLAPPAPRICQIREQQQVA